MSGAALVPRSVVDRGEVEEILVRLRELEPGLTLFGLAPLEVRSNQREPELLLLQLPPGPRFRASLDPNEPLDQRFRMRQARTDLCLPKARIAQGERTRFATERARSLAMTDASRSSPNAVSTSNGS